MVKSAIGSTLAIIIASRLNLLYSATAGIITLLTIQNTRKETFLIALKRIAAFLVAVLVSSISFSVFGFTTIAFGFFVFVFVALAHLLGIEVGVTMNTVLVTHFLVEQRLDLPLLLNEAKLLAVGMTLGILVNLFMPSKWAEIRAEQKIVEDQIQKNLTYLAHELRKRPASDSVKEYEQPLAFSQLTDIIDDLLLKTYREAGNTLLSETRYQISYLEMRKVQVDILCDMQESIAEIQVPVPQAIKLADLIERASHEFTEENNVRHLLAELVELHAYFRAESLPTSRQEFESRALLFNISKDFQKFLEVKRTFVENY